MSEILRRRYETYSLIPISIIFILLTWFQFRLFALSESLPFYYAIFFFGLVNVNLIVFLILLFLIFKNLVKIYSESKIPIFGKTLKAKLIIAFFTFAFVPTFLMFLVSIFYINSSFDRWFALKGMGILDDSIQISELYYKNIKREGYYFANVVESRLAPGLKASVQNEIVTMLKPSSVDSIEVHNFTNKTNWIASISSEQKIETPPLDWDEIKDFKQANLESTQSVDIKAGRLIRTLKVSGDEKYLIVINRIIPAFLVDQINNIIESRDDYRTSTPFEFPLKTIYLITLILMTMVILLGGTWFGLYLAGQLSASLEMLGQATREIAKGKYKPIEISSGSYEVERLVKNFNTMSKKLQKSTEDTAKANNSLTKTLMQLQESKTYIETILENISTAIITIGTSDEVTFLNRAANSFFQKNDLSLNSSQGQNFLPAALQEVFKVLKSKVFNQLESVQTQEKRLVINEKILSLNCALSVLLDENKEPISYVFGFEDVTPLANAQRAEAWAEVATRVAHEIKNPLTPIKLSAERLQKKYPNMDPETFEQCTQMIIQQVDIVKNLVNEFSYHARLPRLNLTKGSLHKIIEDNIWLYPQKIKNLKVSFEKSDKIQDFFFDSDQMKRIVINLLDNAADACKSSSEPKIWVKTEFLEQHDQVKVQISDNGPGIDEQSRDKIFKPNYTTKSSGTGLGLSIVKKMIEEHGGTIGLNTEQGLTTFYFTLPLRYQ